jgi:hypothetical protein
MNAAVPAMIGGGFVSILHDLQCGTAKGIDMNAGGAPDPAQKIVHM